MNWRTSTELLNGDTPDILAFCFSFWQAIEYYEPTAKFPEARWKAGRFLGIAWESGDAFTFKVWTEKDGWSKERELTRNIVRARRILPPTETTHDNDMGSFYFQNKVYSNKRPGTNKDRVYNLVRIEDQHEDAMSPDQEEKHPSSDDYTVLQPPVISLPVSVSNPTDMNQEEKEATEPDIETSAPGSDKINPNPTHTTEKIDCASNDVEQPRTECQPTLVDKSIQTQYRQIYLRRHKQCVFQSAWAPTSVPAKTYRPGGNQVSIFGSLVFSIKEHSFDKVTGSWSRITVFKRNGPLSIISETKCLEVLSLQQALIQQCIRKNTSF